MTLLNVYLIKLIEGNCQNSKICRKSILNKDFFAKVRIGLVPHFEVFANVFYNEREIYIIA